MARLIATAHILFIYALFLPTLDLCSAGHNFGNVNRIHRDVRVRSLNATTGSAPSSGVLPTPTTHAHGPLSVNTQELNTTLKNIVSTSSTAAIPAKAASSNNPAPTSANSANPTTPANVTHSPGFIAIEASDLDIIAQRRITNLIGALSGVANIPTWLSTLGPNGIWPASEINYLSGCTAQRANWPAQVHWIRITLMAAAWHGGLAGGEAWVGNTTLRNAISSAMGYWFSNDFTDVVCLDSGGRPSCPCGTPGFWNTNWFSNIILIPEYVGETCLLLNSTLLDSEVDGCSRILLRAYGTFGNYINGAGYLTGSNTLDVAKVGLDQGLRAGNTSLVIDAYARVRSEVVVEQATSADGSFGQHNGIIYNGNYGRGYLDDDTDLETEAGGTQFKAGPDSKEALATLVDGNQWMIYRNVLTDVLHWDFSVLGRFISFPVADNQATESIKVNASKLQVLEEQWGSDILLDVVAGLNLNTTDANSGCLMGNRMFYDNDYMVQRGAGYVTTVRMYSTRTQNTECTNSQNPLGFHLSDGTVYTYLQENKYKDITTTIDWNLIAGTTTDYAATPLNCATTRWKGMEDFVGGVSDTRLGVAAMRYTNPYTQTLSWQKAWFFLENDVQLVMVANMSSTTTAPVYSVLDQRRHTGDIYVDGNVVDSSANFTDAKSMWHGGVGYTVNPFPGLSGLSIEVGDKSGSWATIGTSTQPNITVDLFAAYLSHVTSQTPISYTVFPATASHEEFEHKRQEMQICTVCNDEHVSAVIDNSCDTAMVVFWDVVGGSVTIPGSSVWDAPVTISSNGNSALIYNYKTGNVTVSDPSQTLTELQVTLTVGLGKKPPHWGWEFSHELIFELPTSGFMGSSVSQFFYD